MNTARRISLYLIVSLFAVLGALAATCPRPTLAYAEAQPLYGFVAGQARTQLEQDWDQYNSATTPERLYRVSKDSTSEWGGGVRVRYVLELNRMAVKAADPVSVRPLASTSEPTVHTHGPFCTQTQWGVDYATCSWARAESQQCFPSTQDRVAQLLTRHSYDVVQCGRDQFVFYEAGG